MRHILLVAVLAVALPGVSAAEAPEHGGFTEVDAPDSGGRSEVDAIPVASDDTSRDFGGAPDGVMPDSVETGPAGGGDSHTVERGDTLWDLSDKYMEDPWAWPQIWSLNPQIENPHWIYPGDQLNLQVPGKAPAAAGPTELPDLSLGTFEDPAGQGDDVSVAGKLGVAPPRNLMAPTAGFVTENELAESAIVAKAWEEKTLLHAGDRVYLDWPGRKNVRVGETYLIYRTDRPISHPETGSQVGHLTRVVGLARVVENDPRTELISAQIVSASSEIMRGDRVGSSLDALFRRVDRAPNLHWVEGIILAALENNQGLLGQGHLVFLDRGSKDGVAKGNTFSVVRSGDGLESDGYSPQHDPDLPREQIGHLVVVEARENTAAAMIVNSVREMRVGDRVEMRVAEGD